MPTFLDERIPAGRYPFPVAWGKLDINENQITQMLPLHLHCLDVAGVFRQMLDIPVIAKRISQACGMELTPTQKDRLAVFVFWHDIGKAGLGFQRKKFAGELLAGHVREVAPLFFEEELAEKLISLLRFDQMVDWFESEDEVNGYLLAAISHHGKPVNFDYEKRDESYQVSWWDNEDCFNALELMQQTVQAQFPAAFSPEQAVIPKSPALMHRFAGLVMLADWIGSMKERFDYQLHDVEERLRRNERMIPVLLERIGISSQSRRESFLGQPAGFKDWFGFEPRPLQDKLNTLDIEDPDNRLVIAESETGSGKTEAAMAHFFRLFAAGKVDGLYFALPTRVAATDIYTRIRQIIESNFPDSKARPLTLLAVPGMAQADGLEKDQYLPDSRYLYQDDTHLAYREKTWAVEHPKRYLAATVAVGTVDQAMMSALQLNHAHMRSVCLDRQLLVIDEVHASDPYMRQIIKRLLKHHLSVGGYALLLSATLGDDARSEFVAACGGEARSLDFEEACKQPYPAITTLSGKVQLIGRSARRVAQKTVDIHLRSDAMGSALELAYQALKDGARTLVVFNTVKRAKAFYQAVSEDVRFKKEWLFELNGETCLHHGHYAPADRKRLDQRVIECLGKDTPSGALLVIGTQTLEQSLDIDADVLITDLAPIDVLLQRIGRLHRHSRSQRPAHYKKAQCYVLVPAEDGLENCLDEKGKPTGEAMGRGLGSVYQDMRSLQCTLDVLQQNPCISIPKDNRILVEAATHNQALEQLQSPRWQRHAANYLGRTLSSQQQAEMGTLNALYDKAFDGTADTAFTAGTDKRITTRLDVNSLVLEFKDPPVSPFGERLAQITIPATYANKLEVSEDTVIDATERDKAGNLFFNFAGKTFIYTRIGIDMVS